MRLQLTQAGDYLERLTLVAPDEIALVEESGAIQREFVTVMRRVLDLAGAGDVAQARQVYATDARALGDRLQRRTTQLVDKAQTLDSIKESHAAYQRSQLAIVGFGVGSICALRSSWASRCRSRSFGRCAR